ncbi:MAG TPA: Gfo/Idh/MocA family oxidoreductase [Candidatus Hydrogenedentes bacterium]|nr:Gfo/Idh/MocA family oxidoreductase [Candidatus Hydrogenedentota bacterium]
MDRSRVGRSDGGLAGARHGRLSPGVSRRRFLAGSLAALAGPQVVRATTLGRGDAVAPSERIGLGFIGVGSRGTGHVHTFLGRSEAQILAVCDAYRSKGDNLKAAVEAGYAAKGATNARCDVYQDFRELLARDDIDAVVIASPENWHALQGIAAVEAGKDVYGEKALTLTVTEGRALVQAVRRCARVYQVGTQQRSSRDFRFACELARNGYLGKIHTIRVGVPGGRELPEAPPTPPPPDLDYELWLGPAPYTPHNDLKGSFNWYFISDYCAGWIQSWGVHHVDIAQWGAPSLASGTIKVGGTATFPRAGLADTSVTWRVEYRTTDDLLLVFSDEGQQDHGCRFEGTDGWVLVNRSGIWAEPASLLDVEIKPDDEHLYESLDHHTNFIECIRTRRDPAAAVEGGHSATTLTLVGDIATRLGRELTWDWATERFVDCDEANRMLSRPMRAPWRV